MKIETNRPRIGAVLLPVFPAAFALVWCVVGRHLIAGILFLGAFGVYLSILLQDAHDMIERAHKLTREALDMARDAIHN